MTRFANSRARFFVAALLMTASSASAQALFETPWASPAASVSQTIGISKVSVDYHRPSVRERKIWGGLVPYGQVWRTGANDNTIITFGDPVKVQGKSLAAGSYGLHTIPNETEWTIIFSSTTTDWGSFKYDEAEDALRVTARPRIAEMSEQLRFEFDDVTDSSATLNLLWEKLLVPITIEVDTNAVVLAGIRATLRHLPGFDWRGWEQAARYCQRANINHEEALAWVDRSIGMEENATNLATRAGILRQMGREGDATQSLMKAIEMGTEGQINVIGYQFLQANDSERALEAFRTNVERHPESWNAHDSLGEVYANRGDKAKARKSYQKALSLAPDAQKARIEGILSGL